MRLLASVFLLSFSVGSALSQSSNSPVITIRKGTAVVIDVKEISGSAGANATAVLKNDIELSGVLSLGDSASAPIAASGTVHQFVNHLVETVASQKGIATSRIAFVANRTGHKEIYVADYDGANAVQLTHDNVISVSPNLSPDGRKLAYTGYQSGYADIYLIDLASGARNRIIKYPGTNTGPSISAGESQIACTMSKDGNPDIYVTGINGDSPRRVTRTHATNSAPTWSPNGRELIYSSDERGGPQLYRISAGGGSGRPISTGFGYCTEPNWSPDGKKVCYNVRSGGSFEVAMTDLESGATKIVTGEGERPAWGPDSRPVIFARGSGLFIIDTISGKEARIIGALERVSEPTWSH